MSRTALFLGARSILAAYGVSLLVAHFFGPQIRKVPRRTWLIGAAAVLLVTISLALLVEKKPGATSYCTQCGAEEQSVEWRVRFSPLVLWRPQHEAATPFSTLLAQEKLIQPHQHQWLAPRSVPDPLNPWGPPVTESLGYLNSPRVLNFTRDLAEYADPQSRAAWRDRLLDPAYSYVFDDALRFQRAPVTGFPQREQFLAWWGHNSFALYNKLREETEAD